MTEKNDPSEEVEEKEEKGKEKGEEKGEKKDDKKEAQLVDLDALGQLIDEKIKAALGEHKQNNGPAFRRTDIEEQAKRMVEEAAQKLVAEKQHESEHETLRQQKETAKEAAEAAPKKIRKLTKALWGSDE